MGSRKWRLRQPTERTPHAHLFRLDLEVPAFLAITGAPRSPHPLSPLDAGHWLVAAAPGVHDRDPLSSLPQDVRAQRRRLRPARAGRTGGMALRRELHAPGLPVVLSGRALYSPDADAAG